MKDNVQSSRSADREPIATEHNAPEDLGRELNRFLHAFFIREGLPRDEYPFEILFSKKHRDVMVSVANAALAEADRLDRLLDLAARYDAQSPMSAEEGLEAYLFMHCGTNKTAREHCEWLRSLSYQDFLDTEYWDIIRQIVYWNQGRRCAFCGSDGKLQAHHRTYEHHGEEHNHLNDLVALCQSCHQHFHAQPGYIPRRKLRTIQ